MTKLTLRINQLMQKFTKIKGKVESGKIDFFLLLSLAVVLIVQSPLIKTFFYSDDIVYLYQISNWPALDFVFSSWGGHLFFTRNLVFLLMFKLFGMNSYCYFTIVLLTHIVSVYLLFRIIRYLTGNSKIAAIGSIIWGISPVNYGTLAWYAAYGHVMIGPFFLLFLYDLLRIEKNELKFSAYIAMRWSLYFFIMATSFGFGLAIIAISPLVIILLLKKHEKRWIITGAVVPAIVVIVAFFIFQGEIYFKISGEKMSEINLTVNHLISYPKQILLISEMFIKMLVYGIYSIICFPLLIFNSFQKLNMIAYIIAPSILLLCIFLLVKNYSKQRMYYIAFILYAFSLLGIVSTGRACKYNIFGISLNNASTEPRYFYVLLIVVVLLLSLMINDLIKYHSGIINKINIMIIVGLILLIYPARKATYHYQSTIISENVKLSYKSTINMLKKEIQSYPEGSTVYLDNKLNDFFYTFMLPPADFPGRAAVFIIKYKDNTVYGRKVFFVEKDKDVLDKNISKTAWRISRILVDSSSPVKK